MSVRILPLCLWTLALVGLAGSAGAQTQGTVPDSAGSRTPAPPPREVHLGRDLSALPAGTYELISGWERQTCWQQTGRPVRMQTERAKAHFDMRYSPPASDGRTAGTIEWVLRRLTLDQCQDQDVMSDSLGLGLDRGRRAASYDSAAGPGGRDPLIEGHLRSLVGLVTRASVPDSWTIRWGGELGTFARDQLKLERYAKLFSDTFLLADPLDDGSKFLHMPWLTGLPRWAGEPPAGDGAPARRKFEVGQAWEVRRKMGDEKFRTYACTLSGLREGLAAVEVAWNDALTSFGDQENLAKGDRQECGQARYLYDVKCGLPRGVDVSVWTTWQPPADARGDEATRVTCLRRRTLSLCHESEVVRTVRDDVQHLKAQVLQVDEKQAVVRAGFRTGRSHQWLTVNFQVWLTEGQILQSAQGQSPPQPLIIPWGSLFTPEGGGDYHDLRVGIPLEKLRAVRGLPKNQTTTVLVTCEVMEADSRKYLGQGWPARGELRLTTDAEAAVVKVEPGGTAP